MRNCALSGRHRKGIRSQEREEKEKGNVGQSASFVSSRGRVSCKQNRSLPSAVCMADHRKRAVRSRARRRSEGSEGGRFQSRWTTASLAIPHGHENSVDNAQARQPSQWEGER